MTYKEHIENIEEEIKKLNGLHCIGTQSQVIVKACIDDSLRNLKTIKDNAGKTILSEQI